MRLYLISILLTLSTSIFAEDYAKIFTKGYQFYMRSDYASAVEMFKQIPRTQGELYAQTAYYWGSICAYQGDKNAFDLLKDSVMSAREDSTCRMAFNAFARFCIANGKYKDVIDVFGKLSALSDFEKVGKSRWVDSENAFYVAQAYFYIGEKKKSQSVFNAIVKNFINDKTAVGVDMFLNAYLSDDDFTKDIDFCAVEKESKNLTPSANARLEIFQKRAITQPQKDISFFAQIILAEQSPEKIDKKILQEEIYKNRNVPFAWQGALVLGKIYFTQKDYKEAILCAKDCIKLSSPEIMSSWQGIMLLGDCYRMQKNYQQALEEYKKIYMNRRSKGEPVAESMYKSGLCFFEQGQWADAHAYFQRVFVVFFRFEYWGSRAYYYDAQCLYSLKQRRDANATLLEYFRRAKDRNSEIYKAAKKYYDEI